MSRIVSLAATLWLVACSPEAAPRGVITYYADPEHGAECWIAYAGGYGGYALSCLRVAP